MQFDHVAIGVWNHRETLHALTGRLGAKVISGGTPPRSGFRALQVRAGLRGMTIELLEPWSAESNDFLVRFLESGGEGIHHVTLKVDDVAGELARLRGLGIEPVGVDFRDPEWREMFIHPRDSHGTVVQIAQAGWKAPPMDEWLASLPEGEWYWGDGSAWWDRTAVASAPARSFDLARLVVTTPDIEAGVRFYAGLLGAKVVEGDGFVDCEWDDGVIRLEPADVPRPAVSHLEVRGEGWTEAVIGGVRFAPSR